MKLFDPLNIGAMTIPNRILIPSMVTHLCMKDGVVTQDTIDRYVRYAAGGAGLIVVEAMAIHQVKSGPLLRISDDTYIPGRRQLSGVPRRRTGRSADDGCCQAHILGG